MTLPFRKRIASAEFELGQRNAWSEVREWCNKALGLYANTNLFAAVSSSLCLTTGPKVAARVDNLADRLCSRNFDEATHRNGCCENHDKGLPEIPCATLDGDHVSHGETRVLLNVELRKPFPMNGDRAVAVAQHGILSVDLVAPYRDVVLYPFGETEEQGLAHVVFFEALRQE